jgi:cytochrome c oxidase subunit 2
MRRLAIVFSCLVLAGALACVTTQTAAPPPAPAGPPADRVVHVVAERFLFTPSEITVAAGTRLEIRLTSEDTDHGFRIVGPGDIDVVIPKRGRGEAVVVFEANEPGDYRFECSQLCGAGHSYMRGRIRVTAADGAQAAVGGVQ